MRFDEIFDGTFVAERDGLLRKCIDRTDDTNLVLSGILANEKIMLYGERGVGKTFLLKNIRKILIESYPEYLPIYFSFSSSLLSLDSHNRNIYFLLESLLSYVWEQILGHKISMLYSKSDMAAIESGLEKKVKTIYRLTHASEENTVSANAKDIKSDFILKAGISTESQHSIGYTSLSKHEILSLYNELCTELIEQIEVDALVFLCDDANHLNEELQNSIEQDLFGILQSLICSFVYVKSAPMISDNNAETFDREIELRGFNDYGYSQELVKSRIVNENLLSIDNEAYKVLHDTCNGRPRYLINIVGDIVKAKMQAQEEVINISTFDAAIASNNYFRKQLDDNYYK